MSNTNGTPNRGVCGYVVLSADRVGGPVLGSHKMHDTLPEAKRVAVQVAQACGGQWDIAAISYEIVDRVGGERAIHRPSRPLEYSSSLGAQIEGVEKSSPDDRPDRWR